MFTVECRAWRFGRRIQCAREPASSWCELGDRVHHVRRETYRLESWKEIAAYLRRDVTTVQRWEKTEELPIHRHLHLKQGSVYASKGELDKWREVRLAASASPPAVVTSERGPHPWKIAIAALLAVAIAIAAILVSRVFQAAHVRNGPAQVLIPLTTLSGDEMRPGLSPDGRRIAFFWGGEKNNDGGLYVAMVGEPEKQRLTDSRPGHDNFARWSPDGEHIAFVRHGVGVADSGGRVHVVPARAGPDRKLSDFPALGPLAWSPNGRHVAAPRLAPTEAHASTGIDLIPLAGGEPRRLTETRAPFRDTGVAFSPDGRTLAYASCTPRCDVYLATLDASYTPVGPPRRLTAQALSYIGVLAWTPNGKAVVYDSGVGGAPSQIMRVDIDGGREPERIELAGLNAFAPATAVHANRLVFSRHNSDIDIYKVQPDRTGEALVASTFSDYDPSFAPDGRRIAFSSARDGKVAEIWLAASDGSGAQRLTKGPGRWQTSPQWSADGSRIAFDSLDTDGRFHVWTIDASGGTPRRLTTEAGDQRFPTWSHDGRWVYYRLDDGSRCDIWKVPATGGAPARLTQSGNAIRGHELSDGRRFVYQVNNSTGMTGCDPVANGGPLLVMPLEGGYPTQFVACATMNGVSLGPARIYYVACYDRNSRLYSLNMDSGETTLMASLDGLSPGSSVAVAADGKRIMYSHQRSMGVDIFLIDNFR